MSGKTTLSEHAVLYLPVSTFVGPAFLFTLCKEKLMKRHLNTSTGWYGITLRAPWWWPPNWPVTGKTRRCGGCAVSCCCHISPALAADKVVQAGETVNDGTLQIMTTRLSSVRPTE